MTYSIQFYSWLDIATAAETLAGQQRILAEAEAELTAEEYVALLKVLRITSLLVR